MPKTQRLPIRSGRSGSIGDGVQQVMHGYCGLLACWSACLSAWLQCGTIARSASQQINEGADVVVVHVVEPSVTRGGQKSRAWWADCDHRCPDGQAVVGLGGDS